MNDYPLHQCDIFLEGILTSMPMMTPDKTNNFFISITRKINFHFTQIYQVMINNHDAVQILRDGYLGMYLFVRGDLILVDEVVIVAKKITFKKVPEPNIDEKHFVNLSSKTGLDLNFAIIN